MGTKFLISCLLIVLSIVQPKAIAESESEKEAVVDIEGKELEVDQPYHIFWDITQIGGSAIPYKEDGATKVMLGTGGEFKNLSSPVTFSPANPSEGKTILESTDLNIKFVDMPGVWQVEDMKDKKAPEGMRLRTSILVGGEPGKPGPETVRNWFKIEKAETKKPNARPGQHYRIFYCPNVCPQSCNVECGNIGVSVDDDTGGLALILFGKKGFPFVFMKAK